MKTKNSRVGNKAYLLAARALKGDEGLKFEYSRTLYGKLARGLQITIDNVKGSRYDRCREYLEKTQWMKKKDLQRLQLKRLKVLLKQAYENVPYYRKSFKSNRFSISDVRSLEDLRRIPILKKSDVRDKLHELTAGNYPKENMVAFLTSGTTAAPVKFYRSRTDVSWGYGAGLRAYGWMGYKLGDKRALIWQFEPKERRSIQWRTYRYLMRDRIMNVEGLSEKTMELFARKMHKFKPDFIRGYTASTSLFASFILHNSQFKIRPRAVSTSSATLFPHYRKTIEKAFHCKVYDFYGSREISSIAAQCGQHEGLHVSDENVILEIVKDNESACHGEEGRVLLTNLHSYAMPFIRYDIGDFGQLFPDICSCGRELSLTKPIGRTYEHFVNSDGSFTHLRDLQILFQDLPIEEFQIIQQSYDEIVIKVVPGPGYSSAHSDFIAKNARLRGKAKIIVELVDSIPTEKTGKTHHIITRLPSKYLT